jgi:DNA-binding transcriptional ArsR family regulator
MWSNCMRFVGETGVRVDDLERLARTPTNLNGMERWGYVSVAPPAPDTRPVPTRSAWVIRASPHGRLAQEIWRPLNGTIEDRWQRRFGRDTISRLREALGALMRTMGGELPDCLPILKYGLFSRLLTSGRPGSHSRRAIPELRLDLSALLSRVLLAFAVEFEQGSRLSLAISANVVRVLDERGVMVGDVPLRAGVSREAVRMAFGVLEKAGLVVTEGRGRAKIARLTVPGRIAQETGRQRLAAIEQRWHDRAGATAIQAVRAALATLVGESRPDGSPLLRGLTPYPDGWRAAAPPPYTLPHYPMVLHRGGFPDGS